MYGAVYTVSELSDVTKKIAELAKLELKQSMLKMNDRKKFRLMRFECIVVAF